MFEKACAVFILYQLKIETSLVARKGKENNPTTVIAVKERCHRILAHIWCHSESIDIILPEKCLRIHLRCISDISALCVSNDKLVGIILPNIPYSFLKRFHAFKSIGFVESKVWLVCDTIGCGSVYYGLIELENGVWKLKQMLWNFRQIDIETNTEKTPLLHYVAY